MGAALLLLLLLLPPGGPPVQLVLGLTWPATGGGGRSRRRLLHWLDGLAGQLGTEQCSGRQVAGGRNSRRWRRGLSTSPAVATLLLLLQSPIAGMMSVMVPAILLLVSIILGLWPAKPAAATVHMRCLGVSPGWSCRA